MNLRGVLCLLVLSGCALCGEARAQDVPYIEHPARVQERYSVPVQQVESYLIDMIESGGGEVIVRDAESGVITYRIRQRSTGLSIYANVHLASVAEGDATVVTMFCHGNKARIPHFDREFFQALDTAFGRSTR